MKRVLTKLDSTHEQLLRTIDGLSPTIRNQKPGTDEWSVLEIVHHLALVETRVIKELERLLEGEPRRLGFLRRLVPTSIVASRLVKVKAPGGVTPVEPPEWDIAVATLNSAREKLKELCSRQGKARLRGVVLKHPFLGDIDGIAAVSFVGYHERRHHKQILEVLKKLGARQ